MSLLKFLPSCLSVLKPLFYDIFVISVANYFVLSPVSNFVSCWFDVCQQHVSWRNLKRVKIENFTDGFLLLADTVKITLDLWEYFDERLALYEGIVGYVIDDFFLSF